MATRKQNLEDDTTPEESRELDDGLQQVALKQFREAWRFAFRGDPVPRPYAESYRSPVAISPPTAQVMLCDAFDCDLTKLQRMTLSEVTDRLSRFTQLRAAAESKSRKNEARQYGPCDESRMFSWAGKRHQITRKSWEFLRAVWGNPRVSFADVGEAVWGDDHTPANTIRSRVSRVMNELYELGIDLEFQCDGEHVQPVKPWQV